MVKRKEKDQTSAAQDEQLDDVDLTDEQAAQVAGGDTTPLVSSVLKTQHDTNSAIINKI